MGGSILQELQRYCQWPSEDHVRHPSGAGPAFYQRLAQRKIEIPLARMLVGNQVQVSILAGDPATESSDPPIALIAEFSQALSQGQLQAVRKLAWNFCRTPLLITIEPHLLRSWSCYELPAAQSGEFPNSPINACGDGITLDLSPLVDVLHWSRLASGQFLERLAHRFDRNQRADAMLLENLRYVRGQLINSSSHSTGLSLETAHNLLARVVFVQFLIDRTDSDGRAALSETKLAGLHKSGVLSRLHTSLSSILCHKGDTFALFKWLNERFNGDLFPSNYRDEEREVKSLHLKVLSDFVSGNLQMHNGQYLLWPHYSFDTIPLEFVSSIYEEFVTKREDGTKGAGEHYTRPFLVDFMLDKVLPWGGTEYDLKILDPCCGSAVFLVKSYQRLVQRWRNANPGQNPDAEFLRQLLVNNIFGVDTNDSAVRVASFSLYLAMCDEIDPRHYWSQVRFPSLREQRIRTTDFFSEDVPGIQTREDAQRYDLVIGNAPWGRKSLTEQAGKWAMADVDGPWRLPDKQAGTLFLVKACRLCSPKGRVCMIQPAGALLFNISGPAKTFRGKLFECFKVEEIVNLSALRFLGIFPDAVGPACTITLRPVPPDGDAIAYWSPVQGNNEGDQGRVVIDDQDLNWIWPDEAAHVPVVWPTLAWGGRRDLAAILRIRTKCNTIGEMVSGSNWKIAQGFKRVPEIASICNERTGIPCIEDHGFFYSAPDPVDADYFPLNDNPLFERPRSIDSFNLPKLIVPTTWRVTKNGRFKAVYVGASRTRKLLLYSQSFYGISGEDERLLSSLPKVVQSSLITYFLHMTCGRLASYRPTVRKEEIMGLPIPMIMGKESAIVEPGDERLLDASVFESYGLSVVEKALVEDFFFTTLRDSHAKTLEAMPGRRVAWDDSTENGVSLELYCDWFLKVLASCFGSKDSLCATIFRSREGSGKVLCIIGIHLNWLRAERVRYTDIHDQDFWDHLKQYGERSHFTGSENLAEAIYHRRVARVYSTYMVKGERVNSTVQTIFIIKPNQYRYWTRSSALRDADNVAADIMSCGVFNSTSGESDGV